VQAGAPPVSSSGPAQAFASERILVVDDNVDAAQALATMLEMEGHTIRTAGDGEEALEIAAQFQPAVVLLDIGLPRLDGYEVERRLRAGGGAGLLLVALTGYGQYEDRRAALDAGFDCHFVKPVEADSPHCVAEIDQLRGQTLLILDVERVVRFDTALGFCNPGVDLVEPGGDGGAELVAADEGPGTGHALEQFVTLPNGRRGSAQGVRSDRPIEVREQLRRLGNRSLRGPGDDSDDAAHGCPGYRARQIPPGQPNLARTISARPSAVDWAIDCVGASTITRISGSVPLGRTRMRPSPFSAASAAAISSANSSATAG